MNEERGSIWSELAASKTSLAALIVTVLYLAVALAVEIYSIYCSRYGIIPVYAVENPAAAFSPPSLLHWLGTDYLGRDVLLRGIAGSATAVKVGAIAGIIAASIGTALGALGGFFGGKIDALVVWFYSVFAAMPTLLFILAFALLVSRGYLSPELTGSIDLLGRAINAEPGMLAVYLAIGLTGWVSLARVVRAETMKLRTMPYVEAAQVVGVPRLKILFRHILPNLMHLVIIYFTLRFAYAIMTEVIVSYLGLGVQSAPSWGTMISDGQDRLWRGVWWEVASATFFMFFLVLMLNILGDSLRDALDPRRQHD